MTSSASCLRKSLIAGLQIELLFFWLLLPIFGTALGREKASFTDPDLTPNTRHRQNVCDRYKLFVNGTVDLMDSLEGMQLHVVVGNYKGSYFNYDADTGIDADYPGIVAVILDELAARAGFTWRQSFGVYKDPEDSGGTWNDMLLWTMDAYDVSIDWWSQNLQRMNSGTAFVKEFLDSSIILVTNQQEDLGDAKINPWNWTKPFDEGVWMLTIFTILLSAAVYMILEWCGNERDDRTMWQWWQENAYLSALGFSQAFEYQPKTFAARIFAISMAMWGLLMTATYTANLASLLVGHKEPTPLPDTLEEVVYQGYKVCTWDGTYADDFLQERYKTAHRIPKGSLPEVYGGLQNGDCDYILTTVATFNKMQAMRDYNAACDIYWVGDERKVKEYGAGFATKADSGNLCTGLIRDVLNLHMQDLIESGFLDDAWEEEYLQTQDQDCDNYNPDSAVASESPPQEGGGGGGITRYLLGSNRREEDLFRRENKPHRRRELRRANAGSIAGAIAEGGEEETQRLTVDQMIGTFAFHWMLMGLSLIVAGIHTLYTKRSTNRNNPSPKYMSTPQTSFQSTRTVTEKTTMSMASCSGTISEYTDHIQPTTNSDGSQDLQKQLAAMQKWLVDFQQAMLAEHQSLKVQQLSFESQLQLLIEMASSSAGRSSAIQDQQKVALSSSQSLICGDMPFPDFA